MTSHHPLSGDELTISRHAARLWLRREEELLPSLQYIRSINVITEFSCAGVSLKDDPEDHSLYAYVYNHPFE
ncbi:hypothetical protein [Paenibacillus antri]|uniref:hypothetical protein n=1 Tax=Paenibacillus antri TaxID=2582848 RepID=UPI00192E61C1|nr:hypothetical protein [Paenibacillus antri]